MKIDFFETKRLILRSWRESDIEPFYKINQDEKVTEFLPGAMSLEEVKNFIKNMNQHIEDQGFGLWAVELKSNQKLIGFVGLKYQDFPAHFTPCVEVGWRLSSEFWGNGYATEAAAAALKIAFEKFKLKEVVSFTVPQNIKSQAVMERLGLKRDLNGDFNHSKLPKNHHLSQHVLYRISAQKWQFDIENKGAIVSDAVLNQ